MRGNLRHAVVATLGVGGIAALLIAAAHSYQPLQHVDGLTPTGGGQIVSVEEFEEAGAYLVRYEHDAELAYGMTIRNRGPVGVTVTAVTATTSGERRLLEPGAVPPAGAADDPRASTPPFRLGAGEQRQVVVRTRFDNCEYYTERAIDRVEAHQVTFRVAGISRTATLPLARPLLVRSPTILDCPDRTLDREDDRRTDP